MFKNVFDKQVKVLGRLLKRAAWTGFAVGLAAELFWLLVLLVPPPLALFAPVNHRETS